MEDTGDYQRSEVVFYFKGNGDATKTVSPTNLFWIKNRVTDFSDEYSNFNKIYFILHLYYFGCNIW